MARQQLLAGAGLADDEYRRIGQRDPIAPDPAAAGILGSLKMMSLSFLGVHLNASTLPVRGVSQRGLREAKGGVCICS